jgi:protein-L-isoaspartate(D-aspartate) O-methyltransferase
VTDRSAKLRAFYARYVAALGGAADPRIERAFAAVPREPFAGPAPWFIPAGSLWRARSTAPGYLETPDDDPAFLYQNTLIALDPARRIHIGEPSLHARLLDALALQEGETVLHVGAGSGYYTAILAHLVGPQGQVHAREIDRELAARAERNLAHLAWIELRARSGIADDLPRVDAIYVNAGLTQPSRAWLDALRPGGRLLVPLQPEGGLGAVLLVRRPVAGGPSWPARFVSRAGFIACQGGQDDEAGRALAAAFADNAWEKVRSLHLDGGPDATCWFKGEGWWLSTTEA